MPFKSKSQVRYMFLMHPKLAKEFAAKTKSIKELPNKVKHPKMDESRKHEMKEDKKKKKHENE